LIKLGKLLGAANKAALLRYLTALWLLARDSRTPRASKIIASLTLAYALSPIDLIPDFIPVLGLLDDLVIVPLGVTLAVKLLPPGLWDAMLLAADQYRGRLPKVMWGVLLVAVIWAAVLGVFVWWLYQSISGAV
jgi:uncharacterized membrane protein YkvA (DUF1232 family)